MKLRMIALAALLLMPVWGAGSGVSAQDDPRTVDLVALATGVVENICLYEDLRQIHHYETSYNNYVANWKVYRDREWFDERYQLPTPAHACVVGFDEDGWPQRAVSADLVCEPHPPPVAPNPPPSGLVVFGDIIPASWNLPGLVGCRNAAGSTAAIGTRAKNPTDGKMYMLQRYGNGPFAPLLWYPLGE